MAYGTLIEQILQDPERMGAAAAQSIVEDIEDQAVKDILANAEPQIRETVKARLVNFKMFLEKSLDSTTFQQNLNIHAFFEREKINANS